MSFVSAISRLKRPVSDLTRLEGLARTRHESRRLLRAEALRAYHDGARKVDVAYAAGITRATLDAWIRSNGKEER